MLDHVIIAFHAVFEIVHNRLSVTVITVLKPAGKLAGKALTKLTGKGFLLPIIP